MAGAVLGLRVVGDLPVPGLAPAGSGTREVTVRAVDALPGAGERVAVTCGPDGRELLVAERLAGGAYRLRAPGFGVQRVADDGRRIDVVAEGDWVRLLHAQAMPIAAALQGLEVLHAAAVVVAGRTLAVSAPSGVGKSTTAEALTATGAALLTDDVLAVDLAGRPPVAHPGPEAAAPPAPLHALAFLVRDPAVAAASLERVPAGDPRRLLTATYVPHVARGPASLEAAARIAETVDCRVLRVPVGADQAAVAVLLLDWLRSGAATGAAMRRHP